MNKFSNFIIKSLFILQLTGCFGPSEEKIEEATNVCQTFIAKEMKSDSSAMEIETKVFDFWTKNEAIVMEIGYKDKYSIDDSYSIRKCVYDEAKGTVSNLSPLNDGEWAK